MSQCIIHTPLGPAKIVGDAEGVTSITVLNTEEPLTDIIPETLQDCVYQLSEYFNGERQDFDLKLNPSGTEFQKQVWNKLLEIPFGKTISYLDLSKQLGDVKAIRAVAGANGKNPLWIVVPMPSCYRQ